MEIAIKKLKMFERNSKWLHRHYNELIKKYPYQYVAIKNQRVIDHDKDIKKLVERINKKYKDASLVIPIKYISPEKVELIL